MKVSFIAIFFLFFIAGCKKDVGIKPSGPQVIDYMLPQGKSPADSRIVDLYKKYSTYFLYEYSVADFNWNQVGKRLGAIFSTNGDPRYVGDMLDLLQDKWFRFYPDEFLKQRMPYKIFLADSLYINFSGDKSLMYVDPGAENLALGYVNDKLSGRDQVFKTTYKSQLNTAFWKILIDGKKVDLPASFFTLSNYTQNTSDFDPSWPDYYKTRGFVENLGYLSYMTVEEAKQLDINSFIKAMVSKKKSEWDAQFLGYPLIKKKYDMLQAYFLSKYSIDLQLIGDSE